MNRITLFTIGIIGLGGFLGANVRYWLGLWAAGRWGTGFPYGTLLINVSGSLLLGFFLTLATERLLIHPHWRLLVAVGFLGAFTTFSTFTYESVALLRDGAWLAGLLNMTGSVLLGVVGIVIGSALARLVT
ncbi:MAG: fluoride efflux transporter CrcB [Chloroflexota bacterium]